jgi:hypothetical protein
MAFASFNATDAMARYKNILQRKMAKMFEREMNRIIYDYQERLRSVLVDIATGYTCEVVAEDDVMNQQTRLIVEVRWPDDKETSDETKDSR